MTESKNQIELKTGRHWICEKSMLCSEFFIPTGCPMVDTRMIREHIEVVSDFLENKKLPFVIDLSSSEGVLSFDALKKWGQSDLLNEHRIAEAYVVNALSDLIFLKQHIRLNQLEFPAQVFQSIDRAKEWLGQFEEDTTTLDILNRR